MRPITLLFRAQPEHAIRKSYSTGTAKNHRKSGDSKRPAKVGMPLDENSRTPETDAHYDAQSAIQSPHIKKRRHIASAV
jgi:hypothetical protein